MASSARRLDAVAKRKQKMQNVLLLIGIISVVLIYLGLQVASYQNDVAGTRDETGNVFMAFGGAMKALSNNPSLVFSFNLAGKYTLPTLGLFLLVDLLIGALLYYDTLRHSHDLSGDETGTAQWNHDLKEYNKTYSEKDKTQTTLLSKKVALSMDSRKTLRNNNVLVIGGSGTGKTRFFVKPNVLQRNCNMIITDPSGELLSSTGTFLQESGYEIKIFNLVEMSKSSCYNPFHYIRNEQGVIMMINCLIKNTTPPESKSSDPFWEKSEVALLQALIFYLRDYRPVEEQNFSTVMELLRWAEVDEKNPDFESKLDKIFLKSKKAQKRPFGAREAEDSPEFKSYLAKTTYVDEKGERKRNVDGKSIEELDVNKTSIALKQYRIFKQAGAKTAKSILISCEVRLAAFNIPQIARLTDKDDIHLEELGGLDEKHRKQALFVIIPAADSTFNFLVSMMYSQLFETLYFLAETKTKAQRLPVHVKFLLDEFSNIGQIPEFIKKLATMRKYQICCSVILQDLSQIKTMYKDDWESIVGNCDTMLFLGGKDLTTAEYISKTLGKQTITTKDRSLSVSAKNGSSSQSYKQSARELMMPDELVGMSNSHCVVIVRGVDPFYDKKYDYKDHPQYDNTADADESKRYINKLNNMIPSYEELKAKQEALPDENELIHKYTSVDDLIKANPEWTKYPDIYEEIKIIASLNFDRDEDEDEDEGEYADSSAPDTHNPSDPPSPQEASNPSHEQAEGQGTPEDSQPTKSTEDGNEADTESCDTSRSEENKGTPSVEDVISQGGQFGTDFFGDE